MKVIAIILAVVYALCLLVAVARQGKFLKTLTATALSGVCGLLVVNILSLFTGVSLVPTVYTVGASAVFGIPGVVAMLVLKMFI